MNVLETILNFLTSLARIIFPRKQKPAAGDCPCPHPYPRPVPDGDHPAVSPDGADGSDANSDRSDTLALHQGDWGTKQRELYQDALQFGISALFAASPYEDIPGGPSVCLHPY